MNDHEVEDHLVTKLRDQKMVYIKTDEMIELLKSVPWELPIRNVIKIGPMSI
jgi:hypothetical protein